MLGLGVQKDELKKNNLAHKDKEDTHEKVGADESNWIDDTKNTKIWITEIMMTKKKDSIRLSLADEEIIKLKLHLKKIR